MVIHDHFAIPFTDSYGIKPARHTSGLPWTADDYDLISMPDHVPTVSTYTRILVTNANLMLELVDGLGPLKNRKLIHEQYRHMLEMDQNNATTHSLDTKFSSSARQSTRSSNTMARHCKTESSNNCGRKSVHISPSSQLFTG